MTLRREASDEVLRTLTREIIAGLDAAGYVIVPKVPTAAMVAAMKPLTDGPPTRRWQWIWNELIEATRGNGERVDAAKEGEYMQSHELKCWPQYFDALARGDKTFEVRRDDRGFQRGDKLVLRRYDPKHHPVESFRYTGETMQKIVTYVLTGGQLGVEAGYVVLGLGDAKVNEQNAETK